MNRVMNFLLLSCKKAAALIDKKLYRRLSTTERLRLFLHTSVCGACAEYKRQAGFIDEALGYKHSTSDTVPPMPGQDIQLLRDKIISSLEK